MACPKDISESTDKGKSTALVVWEQPNAIDNSGHVENVSCTPQGGKQFVIGQSKVTCEAVDGAGNKATCYFYVHVTGM